MLVEEREQGQRRTKGSQRKPKAYSNAMMVCIWQGGRGEPKGEIIHLNLKDPVPYQGVKELGFRIDEIARFLNLPDSGRGCHPKSSPSGSRKETPSGSCRKCRSPGRNEKPPGELPKERFEIIPTGQWKREELVRRFPCRKIREMVCVELLGRHYRSLQGRLRCRGTKEQYVYFRSALELMHFFAELLQEEEGDSVAAGNAAEIRESDRMPEPGAL